jgi:glycosyltransferase involved in cell wall biosynthesis
MGALPMIENSTTHNKVCHVTSAHPRYDVRIFHKECKSLANNGYDVTLLVNDNLLNESINGVKIVSTQMKPKNRYERMVKSKMKIKTLMLEIDADIFHFHDPELLPEAAWIKKKGKKVIFDFHEDVSQQILFKTWIPGKLRKTVSSIYKSYEKNKAKSFDAIVTVTPKFVERLKMINPNTIMVTNYPIITKENNEVPKNKAICFAGGISSQWNHENIINAIESIEGVEYILAGSGSQEYIEKLQKLEGWDKVRYLGRISHDEVVKIYNESMIGMTLLSNNTQVGDEGTLGNTKIFEFMEAGLPVICSKNKIWKDIVENNKCGIPIDPENVTEITSAITKIITNPKLASEMGVNGKKAVCNEFNWETQEKALLDLYKSMKTFNRRDN